MKQKNTNRFWLLNIKDTHLSVSLVFVSEVMSDGILSSHKQEWKEEDFINSVDICVSDCLRQDSSPEIDQTDSIAFILPPDWVASDGKIIDDKQKLIKSLCKKMDLKPMGFLASNEAIVEELNHKEGSPVSLILINIENNIADFSIVYSGKIKNNFKKTILEKSSLPALIENSLRELNFDFVLPPQILLWGDKDFDFSQDLKNYAWTDKEGKNIFTHFPKIDFYDTEQINQFFIKIITKQIGLDLETVKTPKNDTLSQPRFSDLKEVDPLSLGFDKDHHSLPPTKEFSEKIKKPKFKLKLWFPTFPKLKFPKIFSRFSVLLLFFFFTTIFLFWLFSYKSVLTVFVTPYKFDQKLPSTLDTSAKDFDPNEKIIPAQEIEIKFSTSATVKTTGQKLVGERARGELLVFNKTDQDKTLPAGSILVDANQLEFKLLDDVKVSSSSPDLDQGIITLGQGKVMASAVDIGPAGNLNKDTLLTFKEFPSSDLVVKTNQVFAGGSSRQVSSVGSEDRKEVKQKIDEKVQEILQQKKDESIDKLNNLLPGTTFIDQERISYDREIGEETDELSASVDITMHIFSINAKVKNDIIKYMLQSNTDPSTLDLENSQFQFDYKDKNLLLTGTSLPKINTTNLAKKLVLKNPNKITETLKSESTRVYDFNLQSKPAIFKNFPILPARSDMIYLEIKTEE